MFNNSYKDLEIETLSSEIVSEAQELANEFNMAVVLGGDWNCKVFRIELLAGTDMPKPLNPTEDDDNTEDDQPRPEPQQSPEPPELPEPQPDPPQPVMPQPPETHLKPLN